MAQVFQVWFLEKAPFCCSCRRVFVFVVLAFLLDVAAATNVEDVAVVVLVVVVAVVSSSSCL